jgi:hypothetical protein
MANDVKAKVKASIPIKHTDIEIVIRNDDGKLGTLLVSKGNLEWLPKGNSVNKKRLSWAKFAQLMEDYGRPVKKH